MLVSMLSEERKEKKTHLNLVFSNQSFQFFLQTSNSSLKSISHCKQIDRDKWMCILDNCFVPNLGVEYLHMII